MRRSNRVRILKLAALLTPAAFMPSCIGTLAASLDQLIAPSAFQNALSLPYGVFRSFLQIVGLF
ncbi:MAG: hypothetical protein SF069_06095 [Phycisphaerae bacterium]|nr:hypothetical protein [Phycisphaerae bacterium]